MKVRIKFSKHGPIRFIGHLDVQRYFQKMNRRAGLDMTYSEGYSPHQLLSFAYPLTVGATSDGEYLDMSLNSFKDIRLHGNKGEASDISEIMDRMNAVCNEGIKILDAMMLDDRALSVMTAVAAAAWRVSFREDINGAYENFYDFMNKESIIAVKKTKTGLKETDIKPFVYKAAPNGKGGFDLILKSGSTDNVKPSHLMEAYLKYLGHEAGTDLPSSFLKLHRQEIYTVGIDEKGRYLTPLIERDKDKRIYLQ